MADSIAPAGLTPEQLTHWQSLPPPDPNWLSTGARPLKFDPRDYSLLEYPGVARSLHLGPPQAADLSMYVGGVYDQNGEGACVAYSEGGLVSLDEAINNRPWSWMDAENLYRRNGGSGQNGVDTRQTLEDIRANGINRKEGGAAVHIESYAFVPKTPGLFKDTIMAALSLGMPCVVATLLPQNFGWDSSGSPTQGYHQVVILGGDETWAIILNSWSSNWGRKGLGRLPWAYLDPTRWDVYAYTVKPLNVSPPPPPPPDPSGYAAEVIRLTNVARAAAGLQPVAAHPALTQAAQDFAQYLGQHNVFDHNANGTPLSRMLAAGIDPNSYTVWGENIAAGEALPGQPVQVNGWDVSAVSQDQPWPLKNFVHPGGAFTDWLNSPGHKANILSAPYTHLGVGYASVPGSQYGTYWVMDLMALKGSPPPPPPPPPPPVVAATVTGRATTTGSSNGVWPRVGDSVPFGTGVALVVQTLVYDGTPPPPPPPPPPGDLQTTHEMKRIGGKLYLWAGVYDAAGRPLGASVRLFLNGLDQMQTRQAQRSGVRAVWSGLIAPAGTAVQLEFHVDDGRQTSASFGVDR